MKQITLQIHYQQPVVDLAVGMIAFPTLVIFGLLLEANTREDWMESQSNRFTVLGLGIGLAVITMLICGYVTHRLGVCLWAGPLALDESEISEQVALMKIFIFHKIIYFRKIEYNIKSKIG